MFICELFFQGADQQSLKINKFDIENICELIDECKMCVQKLIHVSFICAQIDKTIIR
jgi:hypothetical protein